MNEIDLQFSERTCNIIYFLEPPQDGNAEYENIKGIALEGSLLISSKDQPRDAPIASTNNRDWKGVRRQISHLFHSSCCSFHTPKKDTTSR